MPVNGGLMRRISPARRVMFDALKIVAEGGYASDTLRDLTGRLERRDAGLASQIVFGCLRYQAQLDFLIQRYSGRKVEQLDLEVAIVLRSAIFQLRYLERIPAHAAVDEAVELVKQHKRAAVGLTNAVLRKVTREPVRWPDRATEVSCPAWLLKRWEKHFGAAAAEGIARAALREPEAYIRVRPGATPPEGLELESTEVPGCFRLVASGGREASALRLHDISSQAIVPLLGLATGQTYLDLCAAPGNKTLQALETPLHLAVACDVSIKRICEIPDVCPRVVLDGTRTLPFRRSFDRIFVDAPCSGTGTIGRNPEIKWRVEEDDFVRFGNKQAALLREALRLLGPEGRLVYATCSLEREENEDVVAKVLEDRPEFRCEQQMWRVPGQDEGDGFYAAVLRAVRVIP
jgi:16S rRNA (cytosine967-C5)-methyltransferase